jgi:site-specific recombinase XerC
MNLTKQKLLEMIEEELEENVIASAALAGLLSLSPSFVKSLSPSFVQALNVVQRVEPNQKYTIPKGVDSDTINALFTLKKKGQLGNVKVLQQLDTRTRKGLETPKEPKE